MKRVIVILLSLAVLLSLWSCTAQKAPEEDTILFYYERDTGDPDRYLYGTADGVIAPEERDLAGHGDDLWFLLTLYLKGPNSDGLVSPFPMNTALVDVFWEDTALTVTVSGSFSSLSDMEMTLAAASLSATCFGLTDAEAVNFTVTPVADERSYSLTLTRDDLILTDNAASAETAAQ